MSLPVYSEALTRAMVAKTLRDLRQSPPHLTNALFLMLGVQTLDELAAQLAENALEMVGALAGKEGRPTLEAIERCAAEGTPEGLDLLCHRLICPAHAKAKGAAA